MLGLVGQNVVLVWLLKICRKSITKELGSNDYYITTCMRERIGTMGPPWHDCSGAPKGQNEGFD